MKNIATTLFLYCVIAYAAQAQRFSFEPEFGVRRQHSNQYIRFPQPFNNGSMPLESRNKNFWRTDWNASGTFATKIYKNFHLLTGFQYFYLRHYYYQLPNQPWPTVWGDRILASTQHNVGLKLGLRYDLRFAPNANYGMFIEAGQRIIFYQKWFSHTPTDTFNSVPNGYDATRVTFDDQSEDPRPNLAPNPRFAYFSLRPYYQYKSIKFFGAVDFNLTGDFIVLSNWWSGVGSAMIPRYNSKDFPEDFGNTMVEYGQNRISWNFSLGVQIPLIKDKKPTLKPEMNSEQYGY